VQPQNLAEIIRACSTQVTPLASSLLDVVDADMSELEGYVEALYDDDITTRAAAATTIAAMFGDTANFEVGHGDLNIRQQQGQATRSAPSVVASTSLPFD
jgi:hypothetical protein